MGWRSGARTSGWRLSARDRVGDQRPLLRGRGRRRQRVMRETGGGLAAQTGVCVFHTLKTNAASLISWLWPHQ